MADDLVLTMAEIRARLLELADELGCDELRYLARQTCRRRFGRTPPRRSKATPSKAAAIRRMKAAYPDLDELSIAIAFNVGTGRVNEALYGKRGA